MKWQPLEKPEQLWIKSGLFMISKHPKPETVPLPYGLWFNNQLINHFATSKEAMNEAAMLEATQI